jgi:tight adherence protein C
LRYNIASGFWIREKNTQHERLERIYGQESSTKLAEKAMSRSRWRSVIAICMLAILVALSLYRSNADMKWIELDKNGNLTSITRPNSGSNTVVVKAEVVSESGEILTPQGVRLVVAPKTLENKKAEDTRIQTEKDQDDVVQHEIRKTVFELNQQIDSTQLELPDQLDDGTRIRWVPQKNQNSFMLFVILTISCLLLYQKRDAELVRMEKNARATVLRDLPEFVNKLVLLLNAGLVLRNAFHQVVSEHNKRTGGDNDYFYTQMTKIMTKCDETNCSVHVEIRNFAVRSGILEFMRVSNIISDSMTKGSDLVNQLRMEGDGLWVARRKHLEEKGKIAESKLTFPLVILLLVLVLITIAPAMMEMK